jgi:hypothetical protein
MPTIPFSTYSYVRDVPFTNYDPNLSGGGGTVDTGNVIWVDALNGNDGTGAGGRLDLPFLTIAAAVGAAASGGGTTIMVLPGIYNEPPLVLSNGVTLKGIERDRCVIRNTGGGTLVEMGDFCTLGNLTLEVSGAISFAVSFPGTTSESSVAHDLKITSSAAGPMFGVSIAGTGSSNNAWITLDRVAIYQLAGSMTGVTVAATGEMNFRDCWINSSAGLFATGATLVVRLQGCWLRGSAAAGLEVAANTTVFVDQSTRWNPLINNGNIVRDFDHWRYTHDAQSTDPLLPAPQDGDQYYNTTMKMMMMYDGTRAKWLSIAEQDLFFGSASTAGGAFYKGPGGFAYFSRWGRYAEWNGTLVSMTFSQFPGVLTNFQITATGSPIVGGNIATSAVNGHNVSMDADFSQNDILGARNLGLLTTTNVMGWARIRWRDT